MKEVRDSRYYARISSITKARWEAASKQHGYRTLSLFIEEAVEEKIAGGAQILTATPSSSPEQSDVSGAATNKVTEVLVREYGKDFKKTKIPDKKKRW